MRAAIGLILLLCPAVGAADDEATTVTGRQGERPLSFEGCLNTYYEGLIVALLGNCSSESGPTVATRERWEKALKGDHLCVSFGKPRRFAVTGLPPELDADEILVPISATQKPDHIFVRSGKRYRAFAKYEHKVCTLLQDSLKR